MLKCMPFLPKHSDWRGANFKTLHQFPCGYGYEHFQQCCKYGNKMLWDLFSFKCTQDVYHEVFFKSRTKYMCAQSVLFPTHELCHDHTYLVNQTSRFCLNFPRIPSVFPGSPRDLATCWQKYNISWKVPGQSV